MKVSISLSDSDLAFIDKETAEGVYASRSAAVAAGIRRLREIAAMPMYEEDFREWEESGEAALWETTVADGLGDEEWPDYATPDSTRRATADSETRAGGAGRTRSGRRGGTGKDKAGRHPEQ